MFVKRLISGIVLAALAIYVLYTGGNVLFFTMGILSLIGLFELYRAYKVHNKLAGILGYIAAIAYYTLLYFDMPKYYMLLAIVFILLLMILFVFSFPGHTAEEIMAVFFGIFYVAVMMSYVYQTRMLADGLFVVWLIFISSWGSDTSAYCVGMLLGKHKLTPKLSPKKSIEGAIGGVVGAGVLGAVYGWFVQLAFGYAERTKIMLVVICCLGAIVSQIGDLAASAIKRNKDIKDYGKLIPGHGGILDRFDSVIFTAPIIYYLAFFFDKMSGIM